jgi:hypothetical protein
MVSLTPHSPEKALAPKHHVLTTFPTMLLRTTVDSFRNILEELVAPIDNLEDQILLLTSIQLKYLELAKPTMDAGGLRSYLQWFGMPEEAIPAEAIARLFKLRVPHHKDHINAIKKFIANLNSLSKRVV